MAGNASNANVMLRYSSYLLLALLLAGCLPSSCQRKESRAISPADSLSRALAEQIVPDTLQMVWQTETSENQPLAYPRTILQDAQGHLYVSDAERNSLFTFSDDGTLLGETTWPEAAFPYLAGLRGDTLLVYNPTAHRLDFLRDGQSIKQVPMPADLSREALHYAGATSTGLFFKVVGKDLAVGSLIHLDDFGNEIWRIDLKAPYWRHAGLMRAWGDTLMSLSGFSPVIDLLAPEASTLDTLALQGFDSPMLWRTRAFIEGDSHEAPLLTASAAAAGERLFVLNMRPGWLRVDVYGRDGVLQHVLTQQDPSYDKQFYPTDLAVREVEPGVYDLTILIVKPTPMLRRYRWQVP